ncbi:hypothetical protein [Ulvibacter litoralis]|uniref:Membrane domain of glycerophosphoryl diester phosphodiesterase n=1 Tax=Ulvibacter litoralis TaxID=227084 RepID=A0A1G7EZ20_9FLAO|nr:hypothetical protein [Ulvibacter litoralis]GHC53372.1 hypothetical protein GCM10008083_16720 [Ulvibacter litoralis]SDE68899.1 hypothetical protein SAMN05421855_102227 [Ulvibacter litoralis]
MQQDHIELKQRRDLGDTISIYFEFFKKNLTSFLNIFISYNGLFILGFLGVSYLLVTGFVGMYDSSTYGNASTEIDSALYLGIGGIAFFILFLATAVLNYSLAASYMIHYEKNETPTIEKKQVWKLVSDNLGNIILFILLLIVIYVGVFIAGMVLSIIPLIGSLAYYLLMLSFTAWMGVSFMAMLSQKLSVSDALSEGFKLIKLYYWKSVLVNLVVGMLLGILLLVVLMIPGVLIGIYAFHSIENGIDLAESPVAKVIWTLTLTLVLVLYSFNQSLAQFVNGILYFSLYEETYNENMRNRIDQIGAGE